MTKVGTKFEHAKVSNKDGSPAIGRVRRVNQFGAVFFQLTIDGKSYFNSSEMFYVKGQEKNVVKRWIE